MHLKDGEESEVNRVTFTVGLNASLRVLMVQNVRQCVCVCGGGVSCIFRDGCGWRSALVVRVWTRWGMISDMVDVLPVNVALLCDTSLITATFMHPSTHSWFHIVFAPGILLGTTPFLSLGFWEQLGKLSTTQQNIPKNYFFFSFFLDSLTQKCYMSLSLND